MHERLSLTDFPKVGKIVKKSDVYTVLDVRELDNLVVSMTILHPGKETSGHSHGEADEVYFFVKGDGVMQKDEVKMDVKKDDIVLIPKGAFHKVFNGSKADLVFLSVFEKYGERS
ncbi:MAG: cupin domain-containing protein [Candidatus Aenigmarchaeota archaeon]|nr:cupin domain-containing protein [Candidatus Aenigmarchaeota archaeon]